MGSDREAFVSDRVADLRTEAGLKTILDGIGEGFYALDSDWRIILFNDEASAHFRRPAEELLGVTLWDAFPQAAGSDLGRLFVEKMNSRETIRSEIESVVFPGRWMAFRLFPLGDGMGVVFRDVTDRKRAEEQRDLLVNELEHRIKNMLAIVQSIVVQTVASSGVDPAVGRALEARLVALGDAHAMLTQRNWDGADLREVVLAVLHPHNAPSENRFDVDGPAVQLGTGRAVALAMAVHELCTNATKYGALAVGGGRVNVSWFVADGRLHWTWHERGGPPVAPPMRKGFGSRMIERSLAAQFGGLVTTSYEPEGFTCTFEAPLDAAPR